MSGQEVHGHLMFQDFAAVTDASLTGTLVTDLKKMPVEVPIQAPAQLFNCHLLDLMQRPQKQLTKKQSKTMSSLMGNMSSREARLDEIRPQPSSQRMRRFEVWRLVVCRILNPQLLNPSRVIWRRGACAFKSRSTLRRAHSFLSGS